MKPKWGLYDTYWWSTKPLWCVFFQPSLRYSLGIIGVHILQYHSVTTQACSPIEETVPCMGLLNWRNRALYGSAKCSREFTLWQTIELSVIWDVATFMWRHCNGINVLTTYEKCVLLLCQTDEMLSPTYEIATDLVSYGRVSKSYVWDSNERYVIQMSW